MEFKHFKYLIYTDFFRYTGKQLTLQLFLKYMLKNGGNHGFKYQFFMRYCSFLKTKRQFMYVLILKIFNRKLNKLQYKYGIEIPYTTEIKEGLFLPHFGNITVHSNAVIGKNCTILQGVTIGNDLFKSRDQVARIGDNVTLGSGAKIIGPCIIGDNVTVGANSVVTKNVPKDVVVAGIPAKIVSIKRSIILNSDYLSEREYLYKK